ncbi:MAG: hypothetical protein J07HX5_00628 [halophilic archaeon J07HX5]|nr:MAG: hypothetical protein J07HX5_00628 [halophilic archaeon J07HX5]
MRSKLRGLAEQRPHNRAHLCRLAVFDGVEQRVDLRLLADALAGLFIHYQLLQIDSKNTAGLPSGVASNRLKYARPN